MSQTEAASTVIGGAGPPAVEVRASAVVLGRGRAGEGAHLAPGAVVRAVPGARAIGGPSPVLGNPAVPGRPPAGAAMGKLYAYKDKQPQVAASAILFDTAEITGDVVVGEGSIIGAGVKIIGDSHGPVRIGARVQILENTVLHLLPDNELILEDDVIIGPGAMIHGCRIGAGSVVEPGAIVCDGSRIGAGSIVRAGSLVKQRAR